MKFSEIVLPSNKKFGYFFTFVFAVATTYFFTNEVESWAYIFAVTAIVFFLVTAATPDVLLPLNKLWMRFGFLLGMIFNPIVLGLIFFGIFTPMAVLMRLSGRDELRLKFKNKSSHWVSRDEPIQAESFKHQF